MIFVIGILSNYALAATFTLGAGSGSEFQCTYIDLSNETVNFGTEVFFMTKSNGGSGVYRGLLFVPGLKDSIYGKTVNSSTLSMRAFNWTIGWADTVYVYGLRRHFSETQATWDIAVTGTSWGTLGADNTSTDRYSTVYAAKCVTDTTAGGRLEFNVTTFLQYCDGSDTANFQGFIIAPAPSQNLYHNLSFMSDNWTTTADRPTISVDYGGSSSPSGQGTRRRPHKKAGS